MDHRNPLFIAASRAVALLLVIGSGAAFAQVPVDEQGNPVGTTQWDGNTSDKVVADEFELLDASELQDLVGPVALYPDDLLAIVLPAATYPLQVVQASRFLEKLKTDPSLQPDEDWDDSIVALVNYPEVVEMMNEDLDWTWRLGEAVVAQQNDVLNAVEDFRDKAYAAGNLKSDEHQTVSRNDDVIEITPVSEEVIYVPYYEPQSVVVYQSRPVYYYYPRAYPVYYYPYPAGYAFSSGYFWGVTTAFTIGWSSNHLRVYHHSYHGHPYYGYRYRNNWWYRSPAIGRYNSIYIDNSVNINTTVVHNRYSQGDVWRPGRNARLRYDDQRITRNRYYANGQPARSSVSTTRPATRSNVTQSSQSQRSVSRAASERNNSVRDMRENITRNRETRAPATRAQNTTRSPSGTAQPVRQPGASSPAVRSTTDNSVRQMRETISSHQAQRERTTRTRQPAIATQQPARETSRTATPQTRSSATQRAPTTQRSTLPSARAPITTSRPATVQRPTAPSTRAPAVQQRSSAPARETRSAPAAQTRAPASSRSNSSRQSSRSGSADRRSSSPATRKR